VSIVAPADAAQYSRNQSVTVSFSCADEVGGSGLKSCVGTQASGAGLSTATLGSHSFTVTATDNALNVTQKTVTYKVVDVTKPTVTISSPVNGATYSVGQGVTIAFTCSDDVGGAGVQSCVGTQPSGAQLATATGGTKTFTVTATDKAGNAKTASVTYKIIPSVSVPVAHLDTPKELVKVVQKVNAGAKLRVGYAFEVPGTHAAGSYTFVGPRALIAYGCVNPNITIGFATVSMANATYAIGANGGGWLPSADKKAAFQGSFVLPSLCGNGKPIYVVGLSFGTGITSTLTNQMHLRWHWQVGQSTGDWEPQVTTGPTG
jgi:hypothetical protein